MVVRNTKAIITAKEGYMRIKEANKDVMISYRHIDTLYLNKNVHISIGTCCDISKKIKLFVIDHNGYIIYELKKANNA